MLPKHDGQVQQTLNLPSKDFVGSSPTGSTQPIVLGDAGLKTKIK